MSTKEKSLTGYPSIDKPWLKYYSEEAINASLPECTLYEYIYENNKDYPTQNALNYFGKKITYGQLFDDIEKVGVAFTAQGVKPGDIVTVVSLSCVTSILCFYALNKIGAVSNYINVLANEDDVETYLKDARSDVVVSLDLFSEKVLKAMKRTEAKKLIVYSLDEYMPFITKVGFRVKMSKFDDGFLNDSRVVKWGAFIKSGEGMPPTTYKKNPHETCFLAHTGGTTGFPKTILLDDCAMNAVAHQYNLCFERERQQIWLNVMIPFVVYGILVNMHMPLSLGLCSVLIPKFDANQWSKYIKKYNPNYVLAVPSYISPMISDQTLEKVDLSNFKVVAVGGDGMNDALEQEINSFFKSHGFDNQILKGYGMSEVCATAVAGFNDRNKLGSAGIPLVKNNVKIYDNEEMKECKYGEVGEVCLSCPSRMIGYKDNEDATNELFKVHPDGKEWLHTGDLGYVDEDGFLFLVGRMKRIILTTREGIAYKVFPNIPEGILETSDAVAQVCIVGAADGINQVLSAFIVLNEPWIGKEKEVETQLRDLCNAELPDYSRPTFYNFIEMMPLTPVGKVDYQTLEKM